MYDSNFKASKLGERENERMKKVEMKQESFIYIIIIYRILLLRLGKSFP